MPENNESVKVLEDSRAVENGDQEAEKKLETNGYSNSESLSGNQVKSDDSVQGESDDVKLVDDGVKEDTFVDAPEELMMGYDGRNAESTEAVAVTETQENLKEKEEEKHNVPEFHLDKLDDGTKDPRHMKDELEQMRAMLERTVSEKESMAREYKEERQAFTKQLAYLHQQLESFTDQSSFVGENDGELFNNLHKAEVGENEENTLVPETPVSEMINECLKNLESAVRKRLQTEGSIRELHANLFVKDQEIENLHAKLTELSVSCEVVSSYMDSKSSEVELEKDQHIEVVTNRMLASLATVLDQQLLDDSLMGKISHAEEGTSLVVWKYNQIISETYRLSQCLSEPRSDLNMREEFGTIFAAARDELLELKRKEGELVEKLTHLEDENRKLVEQIDKDRVMIDTTNAEVGKIKIELEREKMKCANTKEKLSLAVTKGKALVQHRDSLKQSLADKTSELEQCLIELQEKSSAVEAAERSKGDLVESEILVANLQETILQRNTSLQKFEEILSQTGVPEELQSMDIIEKFKWLVDERDALKVVSLEFFKLRDIISAMDLPEAYSFTDLESRVRWLSESFYQAKDELKMLQDEIARTREVTNHEIGHLSASLTAAIQEKDYLQIESDDLMCKFKKIVEKEQQVSSEKDQMVKMLLEVTGAAMEDQEGGRQPNSDNATLIERCFGKIKEQCRASLDSSCVDAELFERIQSLVYVKNQELMLFESLLEEEMQVRSEVDNLSNKLRAASQELEALKEEKGSLQKDLERSEEKSTLLREKLSMAVKKGKGLVQDREKLKQLLDEKNSEIEKLMLELKQQESVVADFRDQINRLSTDLECIPRFEADLVGIKDQRDQLEQFLLESNNILQRVIESIDGIFPPVDLVFEEPVEKVKWIAGYFNECQNARTRAEQELAKVMEEASILAGKLAEAEATVGSLEDALSVAENNVSRLAEEKSDIEIGKRNVEHEMQKAIEDADSQASKFAEVCAATKSLEDAISLAENNISVLVSEKEEAQVGKAASETELEKVKEEVTMQTRNLAEAYKTIKLLEDALSQVESNLAMLTEQNIDSQVSRTNLEYELKRLQVEAESQATKLADSSTTIKSLEDAFLKAENDISMLEGEKKIAEQEIFMLNSSLSACMKELAGTNGNLESRSAELIGQINNFQALAKDVTLLSTAKRCFETKFKSLNDMDIILKNIKDKFANMGLETLQNHPVEEDSNESFPFFNGLGKIVNTEMDNNEVNPADIGDLSSHLRKTLEEFHLRNTILADKFQSYSTYMDDLIAALLRKIQATSDDTTITFKHIESLKQKVKNTDIEKEELENTIAMLEKDIMILLSACTDATKELQFEVVNNILEVSTVPELENLNNCLFPEGREVGEDVMADHQQNLDDRLDSKYVNTAEKLMFTTKKVQTLTKQFESTRNIAAATIEDLQNNLKEIRTASENSREERDLNQNRVSKLETEIKAVQNLCSDLRLKLEDYQAKEDKLKAREVELSSWHNTLLMKEQEADIPLLPASQVKTLFDKISLIEIPFPEYEVVDSEPHDSAHVKKLYYIVDSFTELQHQTKFLSHDNEQLLSTIETQILEIEQLKEEVAKHASYKQDSEKMKSELSELAYGLGEIIHALGDNDLVGDQKSVGAKGLLMVLEKQIMGMLLEFEKSKSQVQDLSTKLLGSQKVMDDLSAKVKLLEDSFQSRSIPMEIVQERSIFEAPPLPTGSEISEIEDVGSHGKNGIPSVPSAAHVRTLRKGSADHLAINIGSESDHLINNGETDEDKGHVFKSLNTSGLVPKQGKLIADRIDGIWVSGGRVLMSRPGARLGLIAYWLFLHVWLLGTIL